MKRQLSRRVLAVLVQVSILLICVSDVIAGISVGDGAASGVVASNTPKVQLVFVLDTTGSMSNLISAAKEKIWSITNTIVSAKPAPEITIGVVGYRDKRDAYVTKVIEMGEDLDAVYKELMNFQAQGGGDTPESVNQALYDAVNMNSWDNSASTYKVIFLVGDSPPHMDYNDDVKYQKGCELAVSKGIIINTIQCGDNNTTTPYWQEIATLTQGEYFRVSQSGDYKHYSTPYDEEIAKKSKELDKTRVYYGDDAFKKKTEEKLEKEAVIYEGAKPSAIAQRGSFNALSPGKKNFLGTQELVDSVINKEVSLDEVKESELPAEMQKMSKEDRSKFIQEKNDEREKLKKEIKDLSDKRQQHIVEQVKKEEDGGEKSLDMKIYNSIQKQAGEKNIKYEAEMPTY